MERLPELRVLPQAIAVAAARDQVPVVDEAIDEGGGHDVIAKDVAPLLKALIERQHRPRSFDYRVRGLADRVRCGSLPFVED